GLLTTAAFHARYLRAQFDFIRASRPWRDFLLIAVCELAAVTGTAAWLAARLERPQLLEVAGTAFGIGAVVRYVLRKELLQDLRGLGRDPRAVLMHDLT